MKYATYTKLEFEELKLIPLRLCALCPIGGMLLRVWYYPHCPYEAPISKNY